MQSASKEKIIFYLMGIAAVSIGISLGGPFIGMLIHENSHAIACLMFGLPYSWSLTHVVYVISPDPLVNIIVRLAGGLGQALVALLLFWYATKLEKTFSSRILFKQLLDEKRSPIRSMFYGFELALLTIAFHGIVTGIWEGFFFESYTENIHNYFLLVPIILLCGILSFYIIYRRYNSIPDLTEKRGG